MKSRGKSVTGGLWNLGLPSIFLLCLFFFLLGFFASSLFSQQDAPNVRPRVLASVDLEKDFDPLPTGETGDNSLTSIPFQVLSWYPRALYFPNFASIEQCQSIIKIAKANLEPSSLALRKGETEETTNGIRTSSGTFISASEDKTGVLDLIEEKIAKATMIPKTHGEYMFQAFNILRYEIGQRYQSHYDAFDPAQYGPQKSQRVASFLLYLSDVEEGGETVFPFESGQNMDSKYDFSKCIGLKVKPHRGDGLLFYSLFLNGTIDPGPKANVIFLRGVRWIDSVRQFVVMKW
ncbi:probable prolyl 4-hydroxylase 9 isoform X2 [Capsicum annuum]|uniref:probable prolyl 4-hydroxylase 9 isoform X2 n=1 Tax=Capsicum annuum TaxID=4072 RepID=UPI0007BFD4A3|nr:probable prolyl 4-hydroxylase 9 isoform X2 [Capsicum annuum]